MIKKLGTWAIDFLKALPIFLFYGIARLLPASLSSKVFGKLASLLGPLLKVHKLGFKNLKQAFPEKSHMEINQILEGVWENLGRIAGEFPHVSRIAKNPKRVKVVNKSILRNAVSSGKPVLFMAGHLGNWEIPHYTLVHRNIPVGLISRPPNSFFVKKLFDWVRYHPLVTIFFKGSEGSRLMMKHLKERHHMGVLFDQRLSDGYPLPFFSKPALTALGPAKLAKKYGAIIVPVQVKRLKRSVQFEVTFHNPIDTSASPEEIMTALNTHLESWIREAPEQWLWLHKRWKV